MKKVLVKKVFVLIFSALILLTSSLNVKVEAAPIQPALGQICLIAFNFAPRGWASCEGQLLSITQNTALFSLIGTRFGGDGRTTFALPDLREASPVPYAKYYIALQGTFPSRDGGVEMEPLIGKIGLFPYDFTPEGWARCEGQELTIAQYTPLFSILGTTFGGNGATTFALPDLRNTEPDLKDNETELNTNLHYCIALNGIYPNDDGYSTGGGGEELMGSVNLYFKSRSSLDGDGVCDGNTFLINVNNALFALLGTLYGGDGQTNFGKPDLQGIAPDPNLSYYVQTIGVFPSRD